MIEKGKEGTNVQSYYSFHLFCTQTRFKKQPPKINFTSTVLLFNVWLLPGSLLFVQDDVVGLLS